MKDKTNVIITILLSISVFQISIGVAWLDTNYILSNGFDLQAAGGMLYVIIGILLSVYAFLDAIDKITIKKIIKY